MQEFLDFKEKNFSVIGLEGSIKGDITLRGLVRFASRFEGVFTIENQGKLIIEKESYIKGTIRCHDLEIFGEVDGDIISNGKVIIYPGSKVKGTVESKTLSIFPGSDVNIEGNTTQTLS